MLVRRIIALDFSVSPLQPEGPRRREEVPQGVRDGEPRHVVHRLPLEEGLPEIHRLSWRGKRGQTGSFFSPEKRGGRRGAVLHAFVFLFPRAQSPDCPPSSADAQLRHATPPNHSSHWGKPKDSGVNFHIAVQDSQLLPRHSHQSHFSGNPSAAKQCKKNKKKGEI